MAPCWGDRLAVNRNYHMANNLIRPQSLDLDQDSTLKSKTVLFLNVV